MDGSLSFSGARLFRFSDFSAFNSQDTKVTFVGKQTPKQPRRPHRTFQVSVRRGDPRIEFRQHVFGMFLVVGGRFRATWGSSGVNKRLFSTKRGVDF